MPPKVRIPKEDVIRAAVDLVRQSGSNALNARDLATALRCSTQPIFSNFPSMEALRMAVVEAADALSQQYMAEEIQAKRYPPYKATGMAYIRFAKEERELFRLLYMRDRSQEYVPEETVLGHQMETMVRDNTGLVSDDAKLFHLEMWAWVHGIAAMVATGFLELDQELISHMMTDVYQGLKKRHEKE